MATLPLELAPPAAGCDVFTDAAVDGVVAQAQALFDGILGATEDAAPSAVATARLEAAWPAATVVSFDVFDTLVVRKVATPRDLFLLLKSVSPYAELAADATVVATARVQAEEVARTAALSMRGSVEVTLAEICSVLAPHFGLPLESVGAMVAAEQALELALCAPHQHVRGWFERAVVEGKRVWCVSDTYHSASFLRQLLTHCGLPMHGIQVLSSADELINKSSGRLFQTLVTQCRVAPSAILHIGDNPQGDGEVPASLGLHAVCHPWAAWQHTDTPSASIGDACALGMAQVAARTHEPPQPFWYRFGYAVAGPLLAGFALWLRTALEADRIDRAYFLLRDGEILQRVYRALFGDERGPTVALLESSRRAFLLPALEANEKSLTAQLLATEDPRPAREFLDRLGIRSGDVVAAFRSVGFRSPDDVVAPGDVVALRRIAALFAHPSVAQRLLARTREERALAVKYLRGEGVLGAGRVALVDVGWNGTIQKSIAAIAALSKAPTTILGYYIGTSARAGDGIAGDAMRGYLFEQAQPPSRWQQVFVLSQLVEFICSAPRGSLRGFAQRDGVVRPVHAPLDHTDAQLGWLAALHDGAEDYATDLQRERAMFGFATVSPDAALQPLARVLLHPTAEEAWHIGNVRHGDGLGTDRVRTFASFRDDAWTVPAIQADADHALWPIGLRARRDARSLLLRTMGWMDRGPVRQSFTFSGDCP